MSRTTLTPISYLVLGWLSYAPATPYDLKRRVAQSVGHFWMFPHSQLYAEPARLSKLGLVEEEQEQKGRRRHVYSITDAGLQALESWLREPTSDPPQIRDIGLLKLFFSGATDTESVVALARAQERSHREKLAFYEELQREVPKDAAFGYATLQMGFAVERAFIEFWSGVAANPPVRPGPPPQSTRPDGPRRQSREPRRFKP